MVKGKDKGANFTSGIVEYFKKHPIIFHSLLICVAAFVLIYIAMLMLDLFTEHGKFKLVPDVKGMTYNEAQAVIHSNGFRSEITDSIYNGDTAPGCIMEQTPKANSKVKSNRTIYLVINAFSPRTVIMPKVCDISERQAVARLQEAGLKNIVIESVDSPYKGLVIDCRLHGLSIQPGTKVPSSATITLYIGDGHEGRADSTSEFIEDSEFPELLYDETEDAIF